MHPLSTKINQPEREYNFKVKVNYHNGAVTVHGPSAHQPIQHPMSPTHFTPVFIPNNVTPVISCPSAPIISNIAPVNRVIANSPSFSASTASQSQPTDLYASNLKKINSSTFALSPQMPHNQSQTVKNSPVQVKNQLQKAKSFELQIEKQPQIDCVICERKFSAKDFEYHIELHKNPPKKVKPNTFSVPSFATPKQQQPIVHFENENMNTHNKLQSTYQNQVKPEMLYSFENKNNLGISFRQQLQRSQNLSQSSNMKQPINQQPLILSHHSSAAQSVKSSRHSLNPMTLPVYNVPAPVVQPMMQNSGQIVQLSSGIRYINTIPPSNQAINTSFASSHKSNHNDGGSLNQQPPLVLNPTNPIRSMRSSQMHNSIEQRSIHSSGNEPIYQPIVLGQNQMGTQINHISKPNEMQPVNPFELIQQQQSKIYEYFPEPSRYSISQHRVVSANSKNKLSFRKQVKLAKTLRNDYNNSMYIQGQNREDLSQVHSQCSQNSISSIRSVREPIQNMNKDEMVRVYHRHRNKIDLSNIIGMSQVLAREGFTSNSTVRNFNQDSSKKARSQTVSKKDKRITANSILTNQNQGYQKSYTNNLRNTISGNDNLEMIAIQSRQIYRGTQVDEQELRGYDSIMNASKSSKTSTKTKLPRNYLAVNDFISGSQSQSRP